MRAVEGVVRQFHLPLVLVLDIAGGPVRWSSVEDVAGHYASGKVAWELGAPEHVVTLHGGTNALSGEQSVLQVSPIVAVRGEAQGTRVNMYPRLSERSNFMLFRRDRNVCGYCGETFDAAKLTRDHIVPRCLGGVDDWTNCVTACCACNQAKGARRVEQFRPLLYVPYQPCRYEQFILARRTILADQMDYLAARLPKHSRVV